MTTGYGVTSTGFVAPTGTDVLIGLNDSFQNQFGSIDVSPQSVTGQFVAIFASAILDLWQALQATYNASYPATAQGVALDGIAQIVGISRKPATRTTTFLACTGALGTQINEGSLVASSTNTFFTAQTIIISNSTACQCTIGVPTSPEAVAYTIIINGQTLEYYWLQPLFSAELVAGNVVAVAINGVSLGSVPFVTDSLTTITNIVDLINTSLPQLAIASLPTSLSFVLQPATPAPLIVSLVVTGGASQATVTYPYYAPTTQQDIISGIVSLINGSIQSASVAASTTIDNDIFLQAVAFSSPFSIIVNSPLITLLVASPVQCFAQVIGAIPAAPNTITGIVTPVYGWFSVNNPLSATIGQETESDAQLRLRIFSSSSANSYATVAAITSKLLGTTGVTYVEVLENTTLVQENTTITYSSDFFSGNTISISINGSIATTVLYDTSQVVTMGLIVSQLVLVPTVATATYTGNVITITWTAVGTSLVTSASVVGGTSAPSVTWYDGVAPLAIRCVVVGTNNQAIGQAIYDVRAAGVQTTGNTTVQVPSPKGTLVNISFQIPQPIYIWVTCEVTAGTNFAGLVAVQAAFVAYGQSLGVGESVFSYIVSSIPASVTGVANAVTLISFTQSPTDTPVFSSQDIAISPSQISDWDPSRISVTLA